MATRAKKETPDPVQLFALRERQSWAASVLNLHLGEFKDSHPRLWAHRTFMLIVAKVYERLVLCDEVSSKEFVELARTLAESCKNGTKDIAPREADSGGSAADSNVVNGLEEMVRQIYGTNLLPSESADPAPPNIETK